MTMATDAVSITIELVGIKRLGIKFHWILEAIDWLILKNERLQRQTDG